MDSGPGVGSEGKGAVEREIRVQGTLDSSRERTALSGTPVKMFKNLKKIWRTHLELLNKKNKAKVHLCIV